MTIPPADRAALHTLIRELIGGAHPATDADIAAILAHIARAPFSSREVRTPSALRHTEFLGYRFGSAE